MNDDKTDVGKTDAGKTDAEPAPGEHSPVWPPPPRVRPPEAPPEGPAERRRTLTPFVWLDALLGLPAGFALFSLVGHVVQSLTPDPTPGTQVAQAYASLGIVGAVCAPVCLVIGRRFPILAILTALGAAGAIGGTILLIPWWMKKNGYL